MCSATCGRRTVRFYDIIADSEKKRIVYRHSVKTVNLDAACQQDGGALPKRSSSSSTRDQLLELCSQLRRSLTFH